MLKGVAEIAGLDAKEMIVNSLSLLADPRLVDLEAVLKEDDDPPTEVEDPRFNELIELTPLKDPVELVGPRLLVFLNP